MRARDRDSGDAEERIYGVRPVMEVLERRPQELARIWVAREDDRRLGRLLRAARKAGVPVSRVPRQVLSKRLPRGVNHQGVAAAAAALRYVAVEELLERARRGSRFLLLVDGVQDTGNLGAILRTAAAAGVDGAVLAAEGTAGLTAAVLRASAGTAAAVPVARVAKSGRFLEKARESGYRAVVLDPRGGSPWDEASLDGPLVVVAGGEERGPRPAVLRACNEKVAIPMAPGVDSLNVAVATGVLLFEVVRRRRCP